MDAGGHRRDALSLRAEQQPARPGNGSHAVHVTRFDVQMAHIGAAISYAWTSRLNVETEIDSSTGINQVKGEELGASVNLLYSLRGADRVRPYVAGGAGVEQYSTSYWCACDDALERGIIIEVTVEAGVWDLDLRLMWGIVLAAVAGALLIEWRTAGQQPRTSDADGRA
jgi:opacity protein-like surface antigen